MGATDYSPEALAGATALLRGIAEEARLDRMRGVELWCDDDLAASLRELFRTVAIAQRDEKATSSASKPSPVSPGPKAGAARSGYQKVIDAIDGASASEVAQSRTTAAAKAPKAPAAAKAPATAKAPAAAKVPAAPQVSPRSAVPPAPVASSQTNAPTPGATSREMAKPTRAKGKTTVWGPPPIASGRDSGWEDQLAAVEAEAKECRACGLCETRRNVVFGVGSGQVPLVFIGEAPGADEDREGVPFVGRAGQLLTKIIEAIGLDRDEVYIANILKCRPPANRNPQSDEISRCTPFLTRQLEILRPKAICTLGLFASQFLLDSTQSMGRMRGQRSSYERIPVIPTYHPAALLRNPDLKAKVWEDVQLLRQILDEAP